MHRKGIIILLFLLFSSISYSQNLIQTYVDRCTGVVNVFSVPINGSAAVVFYNKSRVFTATEFQNGTLQAWLEETYLWWSSLNACSTNQAQTTTVQTTVQQTTSQATQAATQAVATTPTVPTTTVPTTSVTAQPTTNVSPPPTTTTAPAQTSAPATTNTSAPVQNNSN